MTTTTAPAAPATTDISGITLQLDNLYTAYAAILEQAKQQLETLEISDDQVDRIADRCSRRLADDVTGRLYDTLRREIVAAEETNQSHWLLDALERRISTTVARRITSDIEAIVEESARQYLRSESFKSYMDQAVSEGLDHPDGPICRRFRARAREAIGSLFTDSDIREALGLDASGRAE